MNDLEDIMNGIFGKSDNYTEEEIEAAKKRRKKYGGTLLENLNAITGKSLKTNFDLDKQIAELNQQLTIDFGLNQQAIRENAETVSSLGGIDPSNMIYKPDGGKTEGAGMTLDEYRARMQAEKGTASNAPGSSRADVSAFDGAEEKLGEKVFGQDAFLKKLLIAFKRPFIMPPDKGQARNSFFLTGEEDSGKHFALSETVKELAGRNLLLSDEIRIIDLGIYPSAGQDKVFLQDLYMALSSKAEVILFEHFDACHISYLAYVSELVTTGRCQLSERYILQKGQLVSVQNSFASEAVSFFSAEGKYLALISTKGVDKLAGAMGAPFVNALGDIVKTEPLSKESMRKIAGVRLRALRENAEKKFGIKLSTDEEAFLDYSVSRSEKGAGLSGILSFFTDIEKALAELRLSGDLSKDSEVTLSVREGALIAISDEKEILLFGALKTGYSGEIEAVKAEMDNIVGLEKIKSYIFSLEEYYAVQKRRKEEGLKISEVSKHMIFTGNPGTGKTTIARIISRYLKAIGVLTGGQLVEVTRADLVGRYVGHTAPLTNQVIQSAIGGVLFIDEAYSLYRGQDDSFGLEAIDTLVKGIEDNRDNLIVILAGYSDEMSYFLTSNSGLKSRFPNVIEFPDYTGQELLDIAKITARSKGYVIDEGAELPLLTYFNSVQAIRARTAGNGRLVRNKVEEAILNHSRRLVAEKDADLSLLTSRDFDLSDVEG